MVWIVASFINEETQLRAAKMMPPGFGEMQGFEGCKASEGCGASGTGTSQRRSKGQPIGTTPGYGLGPPGWLIFGLIVFYGLASFFFLTRPVRWFFSTSALFVTTYIFFQTGDHQVTLMDYRTAPAWGLYVLAMLVAVAALNHSEGSSTSGIPLR